MVSRFAGMDRVNGIKMRTALVLGALAYVVSLGWVYYASITSDLDHYREYALNQPLAFLLLSHAAAVLPALWLPISFARPSHFVYWMLYLLAVVPASIIPFHVLDLDPWRLLSFTLSVVAAFALLGCIYRLPLLDLSRPRIPERLFWGGVALVTLAMYAYLGYELGSQIGFVALSEVYDTRDEYKEALAESSKLLGYAVIWTANVINPLLIGRGILYRKLVPLLVGVAGQVLIFSVTGFKTVLLSVVLISAILFVTAFRGRWLGSTMICGAVVLVLSGAVLEVLGVEALNYLIVRRLMVLPGQIAGYYFEFFSTSPKAMLGHSVLGSFVNYPYDLPPQNLIGDVHYDDPTVSANANLWADAYANFGYAGMFAFTVLLGLVLWAFDSVARGRDIRLVTLVLGVAAFSLVNSALLTSILTHGIGFALMLVYLLPPLNGDRGDESVRRPGWLNLVKKSRRVDLAQDSQEMTAREREAKGPARP